ncbi:MAG: SIR2 family protein [Burkholderiaceae bacterium]|nr:SIR2 family protein [Burkholderiaceae bacterium]
MKIQRHRQPVDRLFVLGAGASYALSEVDVRKRDFARTVTPLDKDFLQRLKHFRPRRGWRRRSFDLLEAQWLDRDEFVSNGLERSIIKRVSQFEFLSSLHPKKTRGKTSNSDYVNTLSHLITDFLLGCKSNVSGNTKRFTNWVFPPGTEPKDYKNRIITFNYDTLIERPLLERGVSKKKIYFDRHANRREDGLRRNADEKFLHPLLLKLHGSVNWHCDRADFEKMITGAADPEERVKIWGEDHNCPDPDDSISALIIPPMPNKPITATSIFLHLWTTAYEYLHEAKELVVVGYSCPPTDTLARTMFTHFEAAKLSRVIIVDPDALALARYRDLVPQKVASSAKWSYFSDFNEYIRHEVS